VFSRVSALTVQGSRYIPIYSLFLGYILYLNLIKKYIIFYIISCYYLELLEPIPLTIVTSRVSKGSSYIFYQELS